MNRQPPDPPARRPEEPDWLGWAGAILVGVVFLALLGWLVGN